MNDLANPLHQLRTLVDDAAMLTDPERIAPMLRDHRALYRGHALAVVAPADTAAVSRVLAFCNEHRIGVVPQGGNTSYCGGATPDASSSQVLLSLARLNRVRAIDAANHTMTAEAGCVLASLQAAAAEADRYLPLSLGSEGSCMLGGNLSTNAGGLNVIHYGMARELVLGLEVVLADGRVMDTLTGLRKDNTGYDIKSLFLGAEGTLGVITAACIKLYPALQSRATAFIAVRDPDAAVSLLGALRAASGDCVTSFELIPRIGVELTTRHIPGVVDPLSAPSQWYVLCELSSSRADEPLDAMLQGALEQALAKRLDLRRRGRAERSRARGLLAAARIHSRSAAQGRRQPQARHLGARVAGAALHRSRGRLGGATHSAGRAGFLWPSRRRQPALQHQPARRARRSRNCRPWSRR